MEIQAASHPDHRPCRPLRPTALRINCKGQ
jgi:hypothetical protein